jgi:hypothetical protein
MSHFISLFVILDVTGLVVLVIVVARRKAK